MKFKVLTTLLLLGGVILFAGYSKISSVVKSEKTEKSESVVTTSTSSSPNVTNTDNKITTKSLSVKRIDAGSEQVILLNVPISEYAISIVIDKMELARKSGIKKVYLILDSPGGSVFAGAKLISYMKSSGLTVDTVCAGLCASMAAHIHQVGNKRYMVDKTVLMFHPASGGAQGTIEQMLNLLNTIKLYVDRFDADIAKRSGIPYEEFKSRLAHDYWLEASDAVSAGLADGLVLIRYDIATGLVTDVEEKLKEKGIEIKKPSKETNKIYEFYL